MKDKDFIKEHKRLVKVLQTGTRPEQVIEANRQKKELIEKSGKDKLQQAFKKK